MDEVTTITLSMPMGLRTVNCYLVRTATGFVLIDTGSSNQREDVVRALANAGCQPGDLRLILVTHGDFDHIGNAAYLRDTYGAPIAMHKGDAGMAEQGDMFWNRSSGSRLMRLLVPLLVRLPRANRFRADVDLADGDDLSQYGLEARVLSIPGHSRGSIGVLAAGGDLFCGDLLENTKEPAPGMLVDDAAEVEASLEKLRGLEIGTVYPGHGAAFAFAELDGR